MQIGRYRVLGELGRGAMGIVYRAQDPSIGRTIAIKSIRLNEMSDADERSRLRDRLFREAQSAGILSHPNIVTIYDILEEDGLAYIFMEFVNGKPLDDILRSGHLPSGDQLLELLAQTANALDYAHKKGIIHRDIKPANVMVHEESVAKVCDFGIAKITSQSMTQTGVVMGTPTYMSPELIKGDTLTGASDQYALGVMAYEILAGQKPFKADYMPTLFFKICSEEPPAIHEINPTLSPLADRAIRKALAKKPEDRYSSCVEFIKVLARAMVGTPDWLPMAKGRMPMLPEETTTGSGSRLAPAIAAMPTPTDSQRIPGASTSAQHSVQQSVQPGGVSQRIPIPAPPPPPPPPAIVSQRIPVPSISQNMPVQRPAPPVTLPIPAPQSPILAADVTGGGTSPSMMRIPVREPEPDKPSGGSKALPIGIGVALLAAAGYFGYAKFAAVPQPDPNPAPIEKPSVDGKEVTKATKGSDPVKPPVVNKEASKPPANKEVAPIKEAVAKEYDVAFDTAPPGADIQVDRTQSCKSPCSLRLSTGPHAVQVTLPGYLMTFKSIKVPDLLNVVITLPESKGLIVITSTPPGASIMIDGKKRDEVTPTKFTLRAGPHKLEVFIGSLRATREVTILQDGLHDIQVQLQ